MRPQCSSHTIKTSQSTSAIQRRVQAAIMQAIRVVCQQLIILRIYILDFSVVVRDGWERIWANASSFLSHISAFQHSPHLAWVMDPSAHSPVYGLHFSPSLLPLHWQPLLTHSHPRFYGPCSQVLIACCFTTSETLRWLTVSTEEHQACWNRVAQSHVL